VSDGGRERGESNEYKMFSVFLCSQALACLLGDRRGTGGYKRGPEWGDRVPLPSCKGDLRDFSHTF
jgi:hypothetical protein